MRCRIEIKKSAQKDIAALPRREQRRVMGAIEMLGTNPRPDGVRKLVEGDDVYRIRAGDYRVVYQIGDRVLTVFVVRVGHRKDIYRSL